MHNSKDKNFTALLKILHKIEAKAPVKTKTLFSQYFYDDSSRIKIELAKTDNTELLEIYCKRRK